MGVELHYTVAAQTDAGTVRKINQDSLTVKVAGTAYGEAAIAIICDGMGGLEQGEVASATVAKTFEQWFLKDFPPLLESGITAARLERIWGHMINRCNERMYAYSKKQNTTMGTTLTMLLLTGGCYYIAHVGDCRVYKMREDIWQMTTDQTYVAREVALGHMTTEQAKNDMRRNVLLQCIGTGKPITPDFMHGYVMPGESYLLCSDGFRNELSEKELYEQCHNGLFSLSWCVANRMENSHIMNQQLKQLIELDKQRKEKDNISVILIKAMSK